MRSIMKLWEHLSSYAPDIARIVEIGSEIESGLARTDELYKTMMRLN